MCKCEQGKGHCGKQPKDSCKHIEKLLDEAIEVIEDIYELADAFLTELEEEEEEEKECGCERRPHECPCHHEDERKHKCPCHREDECKHECPCNHGGCGGNSSNWGRPFYPCCTRPSCAYLERPACPCRPQKPSCGCCR